MGSCCVLFYKVIALNAELAKPDRIGFAIAILMLGMITVTASDLIAKVIIPYVSVWQLLLYRSAVGLVILFAALFVLKKLPAIKTINFGAVVSRSLLMNSCYICFYLALAKIPIALTAGAFFTGPLFMVLLSRVMLGETFGIWRTVSLLGGFIGVILILQPTSIDFDPLMILALLSAFLYALTQVFTRKYCKKEDPTAMSCWLTITFFITGATGSIVLWLFPNFVGEVFINRPNVLLSQTPFLIVCFLGLCSIILHYALSAAYQNAPSSLLGPLEYIYLPLAAIGGFLFFDEIPNLTAFIGVGIIVIVGLIVAWRKDA